MTTSVWGKIGGAGIGFMLGGPLGALLGAVAGHVLVDTDSAPLALPRPSPDIIFTTGLIALAAKMAKADGVVLHSEMKAFEAIVEVPPAEQDKVERLFRLAQATTDGFESYAEQMAKAFADRQSLLEHVIDGLFHIAKADNAVHQAELRYLERVATIFGFDEAAFQRIAARHVRLADDPYAVLGVDRSLPDTELKLAYRRLVADHHPDREIARGLPPEAVRIAGERLAAINAAWDRIAAERQLR